MADVRQRRPDRGRDRVTTPEALRKAEARYQRAFARSEEAREARNAAVCAALAEGWTHARVAEATGLTRARVGQLALTQKAEVS